MKKLLFVSTFLLSMTFSSVSNADVLGVWAGGGLWNWDVSGSVRYQTVDTFDLENPGSGNYLNWKDDDSGTLFIIIDHPVPVIPNIKLFRTSLKTSGTGQATASFGGATLTGAVDSTFEMDMTDLTLYWDLLDNVVGLDIGLNAKNIDGKISVTDVSTPGQTDTANFSATIPMLYAGVDVSLPLTGLMLGVNGSYIEYSGDKLTETHIYIRYDSPYVLGVEAGVKSFNLTLDDLDQTYGEFKFTGTYAQLYLHF
jgi:outer membrane protein